MSSRPAISLIGVYKTFYSYTRPWQRLRRLFSQTYLPKQSFVALHDIHLQIHAGQVLGIIGLNGAGKSTLLQIICGTLEPSQGQIHINGRVAALLELGAGFHPEFTGRENIFMYGAVMGLSYEEISSRYDNIVTFAELQEFIDQPVKTYSSGMFVRLAFAVATCVDPDILVIDEALSVGDGHFARKSFNKIMDLKAKGATVIFCSHSMYHIQAICDEVLWLDRGVVAAQGSAIDVIPRYENFLDQVPIVNTVPLSHDALHRIDAVNVICDGVSGRRLRARSQLSQLFINIDYFTQADQPTPQLGITFHIDNGRTIASAGTHLVSHELVRDKCGRGHAQLTIDRIPFLKGEYEISVHLMCERGLHIYQSLNQVARIVVEQNSLEQGLFCLPGRWSSSEVSV